jgi:drug/metabolite transporter (DMT)-like permease
MSFASLLYLVCFGSLLAFTAYVWLLQRCPPTLVATHTYVNPVVAVLLGWALAGESFTPESLTAAAAVVVAIVLVGRGAQQEQRAPKKSGQDEVVRAPAGRPA